MESTHEKTRLINRNYFVRLALVIFDIAAVNLAYFTALVVRFYVASEFNAVAVQYIPAFIKFAPFYTLACLIVFSAFKLYNSRWKYSGLNDLNRILFASLITCAIQVVGSVIFVMRMPITYYMIGSTVQFVLIATSRFSYRFVEIERNRLRNTHNKAAVNVMVVGVGETSRAVVKHLETSSQSAARPACLLDFRGNEPGGMIEGMPVFNGINSIEDAVQKYNVASVILADTVMPQNTKKQIRDICEKIGVEVLDFSGYMQDYRGMISLQSLMEYAKGPVELVINGQGEIFPDGERAMLAVIGKYTVGAVSAKADRLVVELEKDMLVRNDVNETWVHSYENETGENISFF